MLSGNLPGSLLEKMSEALVELEEDDDETSSRTTEDGCCSSTTPWLRKLRELAGKFVGYIPLQVRVTRVKAKLKSVRALLDDVEAVCQNKVPRWSFERIDEHRDMMTTISKLSTSLANLAQLRSGIFEKQDITELEELLSNVQIEVPGLDTSRAGSPTFAASTAEQLARAMRDRARSTDLSSRLAYYRRRFGDLCNEMLAREAKIQGRSDHAFDSATLFSRAPLYTTKHRAINLEEPVVSQLPEWVDFGLIRTWLDHCDTYHVEHCTFNEDEAKMFPARPQYLIDVQNMCLVTSTLQMRYLAVSYVWGAAVSFRTTKVNLGVLMRKGALSRSSNQKRIIGHRLPATIMDTMDMVRLVGERYLWVDALCIIQDDEDGKREHIRSMGSIYANAYATIAATGGVAADGLRGIEGLTPPILRRRQELGERLIVQDLLEALRVDMSESPWNKRGWTFQEQIFSRRIIILGKFEVSWECHCCVWFEGAEPHGGLCPDERRTVTKNLDFEVDPDLDDINCHVVQYNKRELTYPEDVLDAFDGILNVIKPFYPGGFLVGLPICMFDISLLWENDGPVQRRQARRPITTVDMPPTWSWAAWRGVLCDDSRLPQEIQPLVQWAYRAAPGAGITRLPSSHERHDGFVEATRAEQILGRASFQHLSHLLYARPLRRTFPVKEVDGVNVVVGFGDSLDDCGYLTSCEKLEADTIPRDCEVVALSMGTMFWSGERGYFVLWIEWHQDIAYRRGVGRIPEEVWDRSPGPAERIDLVLG